VPLIRSTKKSAFDKNVSTEVHYGKPVNVALAIAYDEQRKARARNKGKGKS